MKTPRFLAALIYGSLVPVLAPLLALSGCRRPPSAAEAVAGFVGQPPHGGTPVTLGDGDYHVELVLDAVTGTLSGYVLDDDLEEFIRSPSPSFEIQAVVDGTPRTLVLTAVANPATGETVGDSSLFSAQADWLKMAKAFDGILHGPTIRGRTFPPVKFTFPQGDVQK